MSKRPPHDDDGNEDRRELAQNTNAQHNRNNPFGASLATREGASASADAGQSREIAEVQSAMVIAKRFPRDMIAATDRILRACTRPTLADSALYSYSRGGTEITGPSIRLAEVAAQAWGNMSYGIRELDQRKGVSTVEAFAWDMETNTRQVKVFQVEHKRHTRSGAYALEDPRDIYELVANQGARRLRACILGVVPGDVIEAAVNQCEETMRASADTSPEALQKMVAAFLPFGVVKEHIEKRIQCRLEAIRPAQVVQLKKIWKSLNDDMSKPADWFDVTGEAPKDLNSALDRASGVAKTKEAEQATDAGAPALTAQEVHDAIAASTTIEQLAQADIQVGTLTKPDQKPLRELIAKRRYEINHQTKD